MVPIRKPLKTKNNSTPKAPNGCVNLKKLPTKKPRKGTDFNGSKNSEVWEKTTAIIAIVLNRSRPKMRSFLMSYIIRFRTRIQK
jgi:hypothetical protein